MFMFKRTFQIIFALTLIVSAAPSVATQFARPNGTTTAGAYTAVNAASLHGAVNETIPSGAEHMEFKGGNQPAQRTTTGELTLPGLTDPTSSTGHFMNVDVTLDAGATLEVRLLDGNSTTVATYTFSTTGNHSQELSVAETNNIGNYSSFSYVLIATVVNKNDLALINWLEWAIPDAGPSAPTVDVTDDVTLSAVTSTTATLGGNVASDGGDAITEHGNVWNTIGAPTIADNSAIDSGALGALPDAFSHLAGDNAPAGDTPFPAGTQIFNRAYATNSIGTSYGPEKTFYTEPATAPSGILFSAIGSDTMTIDWTAGSGSASIVVMKLNTNPTMTDPADGSEPTANASFGDAGSDIGSNNYVVYRNTGTQVVVTNLAGGTTYDVAIYTSAGSGTGASGINYLETPATASQATANDPPTLALTPSVHTITAGSAWLGGDITSNGGAAITERGTCWNDTGSTPIIENCAAEGLVGTGPFDHNRIGMNANTTIYFRAYGENIEGRTYSDDASFSTLAAEPTVQASLINFTGVGQTKMTVNWTPGNGGGSIVVMRADPATITDPTDGYEPVPDANFGAAEDIGGGNRVVYMGPSNAVDVTGLNSEQLYHVAVYDYNGSGALINYLLTPAEASQATTALQPHNVANSLGCDQCHNHGDDGFVPAGLDAEDVCRNCHNEFGLANTVNPNVVNHTGQKADCGNCHEVHNFSSYNRIESFNQHTGQTQNNIKYLRANVDKYMPNSITAINGDDAVLHTFPQDMAFEAAGTNCTVKPCPDLGPPNNGYCQACHSDTKNHAWDEWDDSAGAASLMDHNRAGAQGDDKDCDDCHIHDDGFAPQLTGDAACTDCHNPTFDSPPRRDILAELQLFSHHLNNVPVDADPANWTQPERDDLTTDCKVCHDFGAHGGNAVVLFNANDQSQIPLSDYADPLTDSAEAAKITPFCISCHDPAGGSNTTPFTDGKQIGVDVPAIDETAWDNSGHNTGGSPPNPSKVVSCVGDGTSFGCHGTGHGSQKTTMLAPYDSGDVTMVNFCQNCHGTGGVATVDIEAEFNAETNVEYSAGPNYDTVNKKHDVYPLDQTYSSAALSCENCHSPHVNNSSSPVVNPDNGSVLQDYNTTTVYNDGTNSFAYDGGFAGSLDPTNPIAGSSIPEPDYIEFCLVCHDGTAPPGVSIDTTSMLNMAERWSAGNNQHGANDGTGSGRGFLKAPWNDTYDAETPGPYAAMNCTLCHGAHGSGNIYNLKTKITVNGVAMTVGATQGHFGDPALCTKSCGDITNALPEYGSTEYYFPIQEKFSYGAWCTFCHDQNHSGSGDGSGCQTGHSHGASAF
jgi:hypothetical protein